jgi:hypothetical protein
MSKRYGFPLFVSIVDGRILHLRTINKKYDQEDPKCTFLGTDRSHEVWKKPQSQESNEEDLERV